MSPLYFHGVQSFITERKTFFLNSSWGGFKFMARTKYHLIFVVAAFTLLLILSSYILSPVKFGK